LEKKNVNQKSSYQMVVGFMGDFIPWGPAHFRSQKITEQKTRNPSHVETSQGYSMGLFFKSRLFAA